MNKLLWFLLSISASVEVLAEDDRSVLWSPEKDAVAFCIAEEEVACYVVAGEKASDVSHVETANIGKLGRKTKEEYEEVITFPAEWHQSQGNELMVSFTTRVWISGQRHSVTEPVFIKDGLYVQR